MPRTTPRSLRLLLLGALAASPSGCGDATPPPRSEPRARAPIDGYRDDGTARRAPDPGPRPNVLLVVLDTVRGDCLAGDDGSGGDLPTVQRVAQRGVRFTQASAPSSWTLPSLTSLLTSRLPSTHGIEGDEGVHGRMRPLPTLPAILRRAAGYRTECWVGGGWTPAPGSMLDGFEHGLPRVHLGAVPGLVRAWAPRLEAGRPWMLLLHSYEAHDPYGPANHPLPARRAPRVEGLRARFAADDLALVRAVVLDGAVRSTLFGEAGFDDLQQRYVRFLWDGLSRQPAPDLCRELERAYRDGVRWTDGLLGEALAAFEAQGLLENTLLLVTSDHGEAFGEHGMLLHGRHLHDELLRVPLVVAGLPGVAPGTVEGACASLLDLLPTLLDVLRLPPLPEAAGTSLLPLLRGATSGDRAVPAQVARRQSHTAGAPEALLESVRSVGWKAILSYEPSTQRLTESLFRLSDDPGETRDLAAEGRLPPVAAGASFCRLLAEARERLGRLMPSPAADGATRPPPPAPCDAR